MLWTCARFPSTDVIDRRCRDICEYLAHRELSITHNSVLSPQTSFIVSCLSQPPHANYMKFNKIGVKTRSIPGCRFDTEMKIVSLDIKTWSTNISRSLKAKFFGLKSWSVWGDVVSLNERTYKFERVYLVIEVGSPLWPLRQRCTSVHHQPPLWHS